MQGQQDSGTQGVLWVCPSSARSILRLSPYDHHTTAPLRGLLNDGWLNWMWGRGGELTGILRTQQGPPNPAGQEEAEKPQSGPSRFHSGPLQPLL